MYHFIYNPIAGKGRSARCRAELDGLLVASGVEYRFYETRRARHAIEIAKELTCGAGDADLDIVAMGGDGTLNEVLNGIDDPAKVRLGIMPCGSGNDFAAAAHIPDAPLAALKLLLEGEARHTDYMECGGVRGINVIGTGIDVEILRRYGRMKLLKGSPAYLASLLMTLISYRPRSFSECLDGARRPHSALIACAGNGRRIGGGIPVCPEAEIDDGLMDIVIVDGISRARIPAALIKLLKSRILELPTTAFRRDRRLTIISDAPLSIQIDGEIYDGLPFDVRLIARKLRVYRP
ncbi:MAG: diacylglycerol kinase family lipid kinase [Clostridia bacterium]|nr:diacylglycerol kinase family lipid kinase [Clostridia bacterium]